MKLLRLGVLASHRGSNLQALIDAAGVDDYPARVVVAISNNSGAFALERARAAGIDTHHISARTHDGLAGEDAAICNALLEADVNLVLTLGYMKRLGAQTLSAFEGRVLNIHPSLLPKFGGHGMFGDHVHAAVIDAGETVTGPTIHLVEPEYDTGPVLAQATVEVLQTDTPQTLGSRVLAAEHKLLVSTVEAIAKGDLLLASQGTT